MPAHMPVEVLGKTTWHDVEGIGHVMTTVRLHDVDARLIAAAPRMLAWIKRVAYWAGELEDSPRSFATGMQAQMEEARAILRDVEGGSHGK